MKLPKNWDTDRIEKVIAHYENQTEDEALEEDERVLKLKNDVILKLQPANAEDE